MNNLFEHKYLARFIVEAAAPLAVCSGDQEILSDSVIACDSKGRPYIPGTALAGVIRRLYLDGREYESVRESERFGSNENRSRLIVSEAALWGIEGKSIIMTRQHVRIGDNGCAANDAVFSNEVLVKGCRFCFELELSGDVEVAKGDRSDREFMVNLCEKIFSRGLRIGSKTRSGLGLLSVVEYKCLHLELTNSEHLKKWIEKTSDFSDSIWDDKAIVISENKRLEDEEGPLEGITRINLAPENFFLFSTGMGDRDDEHVDFKSRMEKVITWEDEIPTIKEEWVIPASSIKGALAHRTAFHYNRLTAGKNPAQANAAVSELFGTTEKAGKIFFTDIFISKEDVTEKKLPHVVIDRFTGGKIDGGLFTEKVLSASNGKVYFDYIFNDSGIQDCTIKEAFEYAIYDLKNGYLPIGGGVNRGHGIFKEVQLCRK